MPSTASVNKAGRIRSLQKRRRRRKQKQKNDQSGVGTASISSVASSRSGASSQEVSASTPHVFPGLVHRAGGRRECNPSESSLA